MVKIKFNTNAISGSLQEEKKEAIAFVERKLNDLNLDYKWIKPETEGIRFVAEILAKYWNNDAWSNSYRAEMANDSKRLISSQGWFESISQSQDQKTIKEIGQFIGKVIANFAAKETRKFREITTTLNELETELKKTKPDESRVNYLKNEIKKFSLNTDKGFSYPVAANFIQTDLPEKEKKNEENIRSKDNSLYEGNHDTIRKYKELAAKIFDNYDDRKNRVIKKEYENIDVQLSREIAREDWNLEDFWDTSDSYISESYRKQCEQKNQIELRNRERLIKKMEQLIAKAEQEQGNNDKKRKREEVDNSSDTNKRSRSGKEEKDFGQLVSEKNRQKGEATNQKIDNILSVAREENDPQKLASLLEQIEKANGGKDMAESKKNEIRELKERMFDSNPNQAKQEVISKLNNLLSQNNLSKEEHDKIAQELEDLNKEENKQEIIKKEERITEKIGIAGAQKRLNELVNKAKNFLQSNLLNKFQEVKKEVIQFIADKGYNHKAYLTNQSEIDQLFAQTSSEQRPQEPTWKKVIVPISLLIATTAIVIIAAIVAKKRKEKKLKIK